MEFSVGGEWKSESAAESNAREVVSHVQKLRKSAGLQPHQTVSILLMIERSHSEVADHLRSCSQMMRDTLQQPIYLVKEAITKETFEGYIDEAVLWVRLGFGIFYI